MKLRNSIVVLAAGAVFLFGFLNNETSANESRVLLSFEKTDYNLRETSEFKLYFINMDKQTFNTTLPEYVSCIFQKDTVSINVKAVSVLKLTADESIPEGSPVKEGTYRFVLPDKLHGTVIVRLADFETPPVLINILPVEAIADNKEEKKFTQVQSESLNDFFTLYQPYVNNISAYEPMYFLLGTDLEDSKFQISFKYRFFDSNSVLGQKYEWLQGLHFGYTQTSFWDLESDSAPFEDTSYKPELFYVSENLPYKPEWMKGLFVQTGVRHESNGRGGDASRSTNTFYLKPIFIMYDKHSQYGLQVSPRLSFYAGNEDENNADLSDYRGYFDLELKAGLADGMVGNFTFGFAEEGISALIDLTYPLHRIYHNLAGIYLQVQYSNSLAESLLNYQERNQIIRLGFAIVR